MGHMFIARGESLRRTTVGHFEHRAPSVRGRHPPEEPEIDRILFEHIAEKQALHPWSLRPRRRRASQPAPHIAGNQAVADHAKYCRRSRRRWHPCAAHRSARSEASSAPTSRCRRTIPRLITLHPAFQQLDMLGLIHVAHRHLMGTEGPFGQLTVHLFGPVQPFGVRNTIMGHRGRW